MSRPEQRRSRLSFTEAAKIQRDTSAQGVFYSHLTIPNTLLCDRFASRWRCEPLPKLGSTVQRYCVRNAVIDSVIWIGRSEQIGKALAERLAGYTEAVHFPPVDQ